MRPLDNGIVVTIDDGPRLEVGVDWREGAVRCDVVESDAPVAVSVTMTAREATALAQALLGAALDLS